MAWWRSAAFLEREIASQFFHTRMEELRGEAGALQAQCEAWTGERASDGVLL